MPRQALATSVIAGLAVVFGWLLFIGLPRWSGTKPTPPAEAHATTTAPTGPTATQPTSAARKITATLFYVSDDGLTLAGTPREVLFADGVALQARAILEAQLAPATPLLSAIPAETKLRDVFVTDRGDAFVDLSSEVSTRHSGGALDELLTIYTVVDALTVNLPAITRVQILIDGKEVETLAGHVDLRHPLAKSLQWVAHDTH
jgi:spore germination protein GerM